MISGPVKNYYNHNSRFKIENYFLPSYIIGTQIDGLLNGRQIIFECKEGYQAKIMKGDPIIKDGKITE